MWIRLHDQKYINSEHIVSAGVEGREGNCQVVFAMVTGAIEKPQNHHKTFALAEESLLAYVKAIEKDEAEAEQRGSSHARRVQL